MIDRAGGLRVAVLLLALPLAWPVAAAPQEIDLQKLLQFGAEMARKDNWREAKFRWEQASSVEPDNPHILNNLAVAHEVLGDAGGAHGLYDKALRLSGGDSLIAENLASLERFQARVHAQGRDGTSGSARSGEDVDVREKKGSRTQRVTVRLPVPARLDLSGVKTLLVASFLAPESELLDVNREAVRFLRSEFRKHSSLNVLDINPPPTVPEQTLDDLAANAEFWKHLGKEYGSDLLVSGSVRFTRKDASGFQDVDMISPVTGQKVRQTRFVEQEQFAFEMEILFLDGTTGELHFRDRLRRSAVYAGLANDPITAFYDLVGGLAGDVLATVSAGKREEMRVIFKK